MRELGRRTIPVTLGLDKPKLGEYTPRARATPRSLRGGRGRADTEPKTNSCSLRKKRTDGRHYFIEYTFLNRFEKSNTTTGDIILRRHDCPPGLLLARRGGTLLLSRPLPTCRQVEGLKHENRVGSLTYQRCIRRWAATPAWPRCARCPPACASTPGTPARTETRARALFDRRTRRFISVERSESLLNLSSCNTSNDRGERRRRREGRRTLA
ncbi:hypothetical protein EVAR_96576_1 [Eumeta japonica]|uniref:Uncharacterized protein n=1 Tax=Eumeta variegata TaxID=151549 RepID=A0A4C1WR82_EUMVA|nr:hypothetical protein EVAR_96576_1 [Eumeta japonica]